MMWPQASPWLLWSVALLVSVAWLARHYREHISFRIGVGKVEAADTSLRSAKKWLSRYRYSALSGLGLAAGVFLLMVVYWPTEPKTGIACLRSHLAQISWALEETNVQHFEQELMELYPGLQRCGLTAPLIDPVRIGHKEYDSTWHGFHSTALKVLRRWIRYGDVDIVQWNKDFNRENQKRRRVADDHLDRLGRTRN